MLKQFNSNNRKLHKSIIIKTNTKNLINADLTGSLLNIDLPTSQSFNSYSRKLNKSVVTIVNTKNQINADLTGSLLNIDLPTSQSFNSNTRFNLNKNKIVNNKNVINKFHSEILEYSAMSIIIGISEIDSVKNQLIIRNKNTAYGTESPSPNSFQILVSGLYLPTDYTVSDVGNDVIITLNNTYIDFNNTTINDIYVIGKFK